MIREVYSGNELGKLLIKHGALPQDFEVADIQLLIPVDGALQFHLCINVTQQMLPMIIAALAELKEQ